MARRVAIGIQDFETLIKNNYFYIDKTHFIKEWWDRGDSVTLIARPRRFGKTLNMSMMEYFFSLKHAGRGDLFEGLSIWDDEAYRAVQGTYPVIALSFANVKETNFEAASYRMRELLMEQYRRNRFLMQSDVLSEADKQRFCRMEAEMGEMEAATALYHLSDYLCRYYGKKVLILLDEYDTPMQEAYVHGYWQELVYFTRSLFNSTFKTNPWLERAVMTGITRVSKESIFSDLNHLKVVTTTSNEYADSFGFTEEEVFAALEECGLENEKETVKFWYDGFVFGEKAGIYNPWSVLNFLDTKRYAAYWANTSSNGLVGKLLREGNKNIKQSFESLLKGEPIESTIDEQIVYNMLEENETAIFSLLVASGYLKVLGYEKEELLASGRKAKYVIALTNHEVKRMFYGMVQGWFGRAQSDYNDFVKALLRHDRKEMNAYMNRVALQTFSYFDTGKKPSVEEPERFYHGFVLGLLVELSDEYIVTSNRESGWGRYDVVIEPNDKNQPAFILEFKVHDPEEENTLKDTAEAALQQIEEKQYATALLASGIEEKNIYQYGFAFCGKQVWIGGR